MAPSLPTPSRRKKLLPGEPEFEHPPLWIHASVAAFLSGAGKSRREAKRRELLALLDRIPLRADDK